MTVYIHHPRYSSWWSLGTDSTGTVVGGNGASSVECGSWVALQWWQLCANLY